jgi:alpha-1,6-mannosyltransferase
MAEIAMREARQFSWERSMEALFDRVYPAALGRRAGRVLEPAAAASTPFAPASSGS